MTTAEFYSPDQSRNSDGRFGEGESPRTAGDMREETAKIRTMLNQEEPERGALFTVRHGSESGQHWTEVTPRGGYKDIPEHDDLLEGAHEQFKDAGYNVRNEGSRLLVLQGRTKAGMGNR